MTDSMKFGPEWLRNMKSDSSSGGVVMAPTSAATIKMAEFRYGREEMLALFDRNVLPPDPLKQIQGLFVDKTQYPLALVQMTDEETRMWNRGINSDASLRMTKPGTGVGIPGGRGALGGRGGSVDRGRGRARGSYHYSRGLSYEESDQPNGYNRGMRNFDRTQSQNNWSERNGGEAGDYLSTSPRKEFSTRGFADNNWRRHRNGGEEDDGWRASRADKWGRGNSWREGENWDRPKPWEEGNNNSHPPPRKPWDDESNLPEWAMENPSESGGSFDASGAFHGGTVYSDDEEGTVNANNRRTEFSKSSSSQPRPSPHNKKEPPNITNGSSPQSENEGSETQRLSSSGSSGPLRQSQSATNLPSERRPTNHPITSSASFSGVNSHTSHSTNESKTRKDLTTTKPTASPHQSPTSNVKPSRPPEAITPSKAPENQPVNKSCHDEDIEQRLLDAADVFVSRLMDEEEKEEPTVTPKAAPPPAPTPGPAHPHAPADTLWYYQDPQGNVQGPFQSSEMTEWYNSRYFNSSLLVRRAFDERFSLLSEFIKINKESPFTISYYLIPPIKNTEVPVTMPTMPILDDPLLLQLHLQQQQERMIMQRQAALAKISQNDFSSLTLEQRQLFHQAQIEMSLQANMLSQPIQNPPNNNVQAMFNHHLKNQLQHQQQQQQQQPRTVAAGQVTDSQLGPIQQLLQQMGLQAQRASTTPQNTPEEQLTIEQFMNAFRQKQLNVPQQLPQQLPPQLPQQQQQPVTMESVWGGAAAAAPSFPAWSAAQLAQQPQSLWSEPVTKGIKTEQEILEEQFRAEELKKEEIRKQEELQRLKDEEEERIRKLKIEEKELERKRAEEEREKRRLREEEERKKREAAAAKKAEQDRLKKEEDKKKKEEEKRRKEEEKRKIDEEKKKAEAEKKRLEDENKKREEIVKRQNEALKRIQEQQQQARAVKTTPAPWTAPDTAGASLADIQKTERKQQQQLREQKEMLKAYQEKHQHEQQLKNSKSSSSLNLKWAESTKVQPTRVKSLAEIQAEEQERMLKQAEKDKAERMAAAKEIPVAATGSIWASANQTLSWNSNQGAPSVWGNMPITNNTAVGGTVARFFDEVNKVKPKATKPTQPTATKSQTKIKAKKEEDLVMKLFENKLTNSSKSEEFNKWCHKSLSGFSNSVDIATFRDFLLTIESPSAVEDYVLECLGDSKEARNFSAEFIRKTRSTDRPQSNHRPETQPNPSNQSNNNNNNNFQEVKGKNKKVKKSKMTKVDSRILGFNVTAAPDRLNVGDRDYGEAP